MYPRRSSIRLQLSPQQAEFLYWELLGLLDHYQQTGIHRLEPHEEAALRIAAAELELGLARATAVAELQLEQLRAMTNRSSGASA
jgi:hypothetical protein